MNSGVHPGWVRTRLRRRDRRDVAGTYEANFGEHIQAGPIDEVELFPEVAVVIGASVPGL